LPGLNSLVGSKCTFTCLDEILPGALCVGGVSDTNDELVSDITRPDAARCNLAVGDFASARIIVQSKDLDGGRRIGKVPNILSHISDK
jgi:hypothetical protein